MVCLKTVTFFLLFNLFRREEFDKTDESDSSNLINELVIATDLRKVCSIFVVFLII
jgi:hypothetical protein